MAVANKDELSLYVYNYKRVHGIYKITNTINGKFYIGSAVDLYVRWYKHKTDLMKNKHENPRLQNSFNKYKLDAFTFEVVEIVWNKDNLIEREQYWLDILDATNKNHGFNINKIANSRLGSKHSEETRRKISKNRKGIYPNEETKRKISESNKGKKHSEESKLKMSISRIGFKHTEDTKKKISDIQRGKKREPRTEDVKQKISAKNKGRTTMPKGEDVYNSLFTNEQVEIIKLKMLDGYSNSELAKEYNTDSLIFSDIRRNKTYKNVRSDIDLSHTVEKRFTKDDVINIRELFGSGISITEIAEKFNKSTRSIRDIINRKTWKEL